MSENKVLEQQKEALKERIKFCKDVIISRTEEMENCREVLRKLG